MLEFADDFPSTPKAVGHARHKVVDFAKKCGFPALRIPDIELAVGEACANAVEHGHSEERGFCVACEYCEGVLTIEVRDYHGGQSLSAESKAARLGVKSGGGLGFVLINALTDAWSLETSKGEGSLLVFKVRS